MTIITDDYDGGDPYYFSAHGTSIVLKAGVVYNYDGPYGAFMLNGSFDRFLIAGLVYSSTFGLYLSDASAQIDIAASAVISGYSAAIYTASGAAGGAIISNHGVVSGLSGISSGNATAPMWVHNFGLIEATGPGNFAVFTGTGNDVIDGTGTFAGIINGGAGDDTIDTHLATATGIIIGGAGDDTYIIAAGQTVNEGTYGSDEGGRDVIVSYGDYALPDYVESLSILGSATIGRGNGLDNSISGNDNGDHLFGGAGKDNIAAGSGDDILRGGDGNDTLTSLEGNDQFFGNAGDDLVIVGLEQVKVDGGAGTDTVAFLYNDTAIVADLTLATGIVTGGAAALDTLIRIEGVWGSAFNDTLTGNGLKNDLLGYFGDDTIKGMGGDDIVEGYDGADTLDGGDGIDILSFANDTAGVTASLLTNVGTAGAALGDTYLNFENIRGGFGADTLTGSAGANAIEGGEGNDILNGGNGADTLYGDRGDDMLTGGTAKDLFGFRDVALSNGTTLIGGFGKDTITDFQDGTDRISFVGDSQVHSLSDLTISKSGSSTLVTVTGTTDQIVLLHFDPVNFTSADVIFG